MTSPPTGGRPLVTFDLFSALLDSRAGGTAALAALGRDWPVPASAVYDSWDARNKELQRRCERWVPFAQLSHQALTAAYRELGLTGDADADAELLLSSVADWPLWPDVAAGLAEVRAVARVGVLSNVDDALLARTRAAPLVDPALRLTSELLQAYKPRPELYREARARVGPFVHVASSARDVRGALEAGMSVVRLARPGHVLDPAGPVPDHEVNRVADLLPVLARLETA
jgi:2-haloacid dehalogenase